MFKKGDFQPLHLTRLHGNLVRKPNANLRGTQTIFVKSVVQVAHERLAKKPFLLLDEFNVPEFSTYGRKFYDKQERREHAPPRGGAIVLNGKKDIARENQRLTKSKVEPVNPVGVAENRQKQ